MLKQKMSKLNIPYFKEKQTFLDNIIRIQQEMSAKNTFGLKNFYVAPKNYLHFVFLILLAYKGKITSSDMILFELDRDLPQNWIIEIYYMDPRKTMITFK